MNAYTTTFMLINSLALLLLPRQWAPLPLLVGACYMTLGQGIEIGPFSFTVIRILMAAGVIRVLMRRERMVGGTNGMDRLMLFWSSWMLISSVFHTDSMSAFVFRLGLVYNACGIYFLIRIFCRSLDDVIGLCRVMTILLVPVAVEMVYEKLAAHNLFSVFGGISEAPAIRDGKLRASGPFAHAILAGTVGAVSLPLIFALGRKYRNEVLIGIGACTAMIIASTSSGPILSATAAMGALMMWRFRHLTRIFRWFAVAAYIALDLVMKEPAYYLMSRVDITGSSTGWHRAYLIETAINHFSEWWIAGTDYTRHWMPTGVSWSPDHTDITNEYIKMGVIGGLPLMILFILIIVTGFSFVGKILRRSPEQSLESKFMIWALGASLFAHAATFMSVSYFDQSFVFIYLTLAAIASVWSATVMASKQSQQATYIPSLSGA